MIWFVQVEEGIRYISETVSQWCACPICSFSIRMSVCYVLIFFFFSSRRRHTRYWRDWSSDVCSSDLPNSEKEFEQVVKDAQSTGLLPAGEELNDAQKQQIRQQWGTIMVLSRKGTQAEIGRASCRERV